MANRKIVTPIYCIVSTPYLYLLKNKMDFGKLFLSSVLVIVYYLLFGHESIDKLLQEEMTISHSDEEPQKIKAPGNARKMFGC